MARLLFEEQGIRVRRGRLAPAGTIYVVYTDTAGTAPADISTTSGGSAVPGSAVTVADIAGLGPSAFRFYGPDGVDTLYLRCLSDASLGVQEIEADTDERLDALEAGSGGGAHPDLATHDALGLATDAELTAHVVAADPHGGYVLESDHTLATHDTLGLATDTELSAHAAAANPHPGYATDTDLAAHEADTTSIHGIADTSTLATDADLAAHAGASDPHGDRAYADATAQGLDPKASVLVKSTGNLTLSGEQTIDGVLTAASRVLVANQTAPEDNGIYVTAAGAWTRATDADTSGEVTPGLYTFVEEGTTQASSGWVLTTPAPIVLGTTPLTFSQFSQAGQIFGGAGLVKTGNTLDVSPGPGLTVDADTVGIAPGGVSATELAASAVTDAKVAPAAAVAESKLALTFPTHAEDHAARHAAAGADPLAGYATAADQAAHESAIDPHQGYVLESAHTLATHDALGLATDAELTAHEADTTIIHGIADTTKLLVREPLTQAVTDAHAANGRVLRLSEGLHTLAGPINLTYPLTIEGEGVDFGGGGSPPLGTRIAGVVGQQMFVSPSSPGKRSAFSLRNVKLVGGTDQFYSPEHINWVEFENVEFSGATNAALRFRGSCEQLSMRRCQVQGAGYGFLFENVANPAGFNYLDKSDFIECIFNSTAKTGISIDVTLANSISFVNTIINYCGWHGFHADGGIRALNFYNVNTEGCGSLGKKNRTTLSGIVSSGATSATLASATGWATGDTITIAGAGVNGVDFSDTVTISGTTATWSTPTSTTVTNPKVTNAIYDDFHFGTTIAQPSRIVFVGSVFGAEATNGKLRYAINNTVAASMSLLECSTGTAVPVYDPSMRVNVLGGSVDVRQTAALTGRNPLGIAVPTQTGGDNKRAYMTSAPGGALDLFLVDSNVAGTGTYGEGALRILNSNRDAVLKWGWDGTNRKLGFYNVNPQTRPTAYTQTYSTASKTHTAYTADAESSVYTGAADSEAKLADLNALRVAVENLRTGYESTSKVLNQVIDDLQTLGLLQ